MLSPLELENKRILTNKRRYDRYEMDEYLDMVFENYKELYNEYEEQKKHIKTLSEGIQYYRSIESTMQKALLLAEKTSKETKDAAILKAEAIEKDANNKASQIIDTAEHEYTRIREKCIELVTQFNNYKAQLQVAANEQLRLITSATFDIETPVIDRDDNVSAAGLESVNAAGVSQVAAEPAEAYQPQREPVEPVTIQAETNEPSATPSSFAKLQPESGTLQAETAQTDIQASVPAEEPIKASTGAQSITEEHSKSNVYSYSATGNTNPLPDLSEFIENEKVSSVSTEIPKPEPVAEVFEAAPAAEPQMAAPTPEPEVAPVSTQAGEVIAPAKTSVAGEIVAPIQTSTEETVPVQNEPEPDIASQFEMYTEVPPAEPTPAAVAPEPVSEKTMVLPDVKDVDRESLRTSKTYTEEEQLQILSAETINLNDSIKAVKETEMLEVPKREEPEMLSLESDPGTLAQQAKPQTGLDTILQSMTIGKKKKTNGESAEDPFEFLGSVDDF